MSIPNQETCAKIDKLITYLREEPRRNNMDFWGLKIDPNLKLEDLKLGDYLEGFVEYSTQLETYVDDGMLEALIDQKPPCGAVHCMAGGCLISAGLVNPTFRRGIEFYEFEPNTPVRAREYLGISGEDGCKLFFLKSWSKYWKGELVGWPESFETALAQTDPGSPEYTEVCVSRLVHYKQTGD
jgi:hypothetical protein